MSCNCWKGYGRVPGTRPCASGSCRKRFAQRKRVVGVLVGKRMGRV